MYLHRPGIYFISKLTQCDIQSTYRIQDEVIHIICLIVAASRDCERSLHIPRIEKPGQIGKTTLCRGLVGKLIQLAIFDGFKRKHPPEGPPSVRLSRGTFC
jgi:hypothetical protein